MTWVGVSVGGPSVMLLLVWGSFGLVSFSPVCTASALVSLSHSMSGEGNRDSNLTEEPHAATTPPRSGVKRGCTGSPRITAEQPPRVRQRREAAAVRLTHSRRSTPAFARAPAATTAVIAMVCRKRRDWRVMERCLAALFDKDEREALAIGRAHFMVEHAGVRGDRHKLAALLRDMEKALIHTQADITLRRRLRRLDTLVTWKLAQEADPTPAMLAYRNGRNPEEQLQFLENQEYALVPPLGTYRVLMLPEELVLHRDDADAPPPALHPEKLATMWILDDPMGAKRDAQYKSDWWHLDRYHASDQYKYDCGYWARP